MKLRSLLVVVACVAAPPVLACDGPALGPVTERFALASTVAIIRVTTVRASARDTAVVEGTAEAVEVLKGSLPSIVPVRGYVPSVDCWAPMQLGKQYVVFLPNAAGKQHIWFTLFSTTIELSGIPSGVLRAWRGEA